MMGMRRWTWTTKASFFLVLVWVASLGVGGSAASLRRSSLGSGLVLNPVGNGGGVGIGSGGRGEENDTLALPLALVSQSRIAVLASPTPAPPSPPSDPYIYPVPRSRVTITFSNYGDPVTKNPALICLTAVSHDFWEHATRELDKVVGVPLEYRFRGVGLTIVPIGRELMWRSIGLMEQGLRYFVQTYGARDMLFDISVAGIRERVATGRLTNV